MHEDNGDIGEVQGWSGDAEDGGGGLRGANGNTVECYAENNDEPDGIDRCMGVFVYFGEEAAYTVILDVFLLYI